MSLCDTDTTPILKDLEKACSDYSNYSSINTEKVRGTYEDAIDALLGELDEYCQVMDLIRSDTNLCMDTILPRIKDQCTRLDSTFLQIDQLKVVVNTIGENVNRMEELIDRANSELKSPSKISLMFKSLLSKKKSENKRLEFTKMQIFSTKELLDKLPDSSE